MAVENFRQVDLQLRALEDIGEEQIDKVKRAVALEFLDVVIRETPVRYGAARSAWNATSSTPVFVEVPQPADKSVIPAPDARRMIAAVGGKPFDAVYITNGQSYIIPLEDGHSKRGSHMTDHAINAVRAKFGAN